MEYTLEELKQVLADLFLANRRLRQDLAAANSRCEQMQELLQAKAETESAEP